MRNTKLLFCSATSGNLQPLKDFSVIGCITNKKYKFEDTYIKKNIDGESFYFREILRKKGRILETVIPSNNFYITLVEMLQSVDYKCSPAESSGSYFMGVRQREKYKPCTPDNPFTLAEDLFDAPEGNYLRPLIRLSSLQSNYQSSMEKQIFYQAIASWYSLADQTDSVNRYVGKWQSIGNAAKPNGDSKISASHLAPAAEQILQASKTNQVVMFNEAHTQIKHRYFFGSLLKDMYDLGFRYLALEALTKDDSLSIRKFPTLASGFYTREPVMANMIRHALNLGYTLVPYDVNSDKREYLQAENIMQQTLHRDSSARVLILCGHGHIDETDTLNRTKMMAAQFFEMTGINPLTVNQTDFEKTADQLDSADAFIWNPESTSGPRPRMKNDIYVMNNISIHDKDLTFGMNSRKSEIPVPWKELPSRETFILTIYNENEMTVKNATPVAIRILNRNQLQEIVYLKPGRYLMKIKNYFGDTVWKESLKVEI